MNDINKLHVDQQKGLDLCSISETAMVPGKNPMMVGRSSIDCKIKQIESAPTKDVRSRTLKTFSKFFSVSEHFDLW